jgi:excisionase family DNA binding protein
VAGMSTRAQLPEIISVDEAAEYLGISTWTMRNHLKSGLVPGVKIGRRWFINASHLADVLNGSSRSSAAPLGVSPTPPMADTRPGFSATTTAPGRELATNESEQGGNQ